MSSKNINIKLVGRYNSMQKKILIVDDDASIIDSLKYLLEDEGYIVDTCGNGSFMNNFSDPKPDLILLDYLLPGENGGTITKKLKKTNDTKNIPVIIISASYNIKDIVAEAGADDFIPKPYDLNDLLNTLEKHLTNNNSSPNLTS
jgi:DNA-binding response OmpR family regulator